MRRGDFARGAGGAGAHRDPGEVEGHQLRLGRHAGHGDATRTRHTCGGAAVNDGLRAQLPDVALEAVAQAGEPGLVARSEEHTSELQSLMRISYAVFCLKKKKKERHQTQENKMNVKD